MSAHTCWPTEGQAELSSHSAFPTAPCLSLPAHRDFLLLSRLILPCVFHPRANPPIRTLRDLITVLSNKVIKQFPWEVCS